MSGPEPASLCIAIAAKGHVDIEPCLGALSYDIDNIAFPVTIHIAHDQQLDLELIQRLIPSRPLNDDIGSNARFQVVTTQCHELTSIFKLWGIALAKAGEHYAAVIDASCPPSKEWLSTVVENIQKDITVFYGSVEPGWNLDNTNVIGYIIEYAQFKSPVQCDSEYPGNNIIFKTTLLGSKEDLISNGFFKTFMLWKLEREHSQKPQYSDNMPVIYFKTFQFLHYMKRRRDHGRCFAASRLEQKHQPPKWACLAFTPFLFLLRTARIYKWIKQKPELVSAFFRYISSIVCSEIAWSYGEFLGYGFGDNGTCQHLD